MQTFKRSLVKICTIGFDTRLFAVATFIGLIWMLIPLYRLCVYAIPFFDDYYAAYNAKVTMSSPTDIAGCLQAAYDSSVSAWHTWAGTFVTKFLMAMVPLVFGESYYFLGPVFLITILVIGPFIFTGVLVRDLFHAAWDVILGVQSLTTCYMILFLVSPQQGFYWYNGGVNYIAMHALLMMLAAVIVRLFHTKNTRTRILMMILASILSFLIGGGNLITALQTGVILACLMIIFFFTRRKTLPYCLLPVLTYAISMAVNVLAPGNAVRGALFVGRSMKPVDAILASFSEGLRFFGIFTDWRSILMILLFAPFFWKIAARPDLFRFHPRLYPVILVASVCLYACGFTPPLYATGAVDLSRVMNVLKITLQLLLLINITYITGCIRQSLPVPSLTAKSPLAALSSWDGRIFWLILVLWLAFWNYHLRIQPNPIGAYTSWGASYYLRTGQAETLRREYQERVTLLKSAERDVVLEPYTVLPWFLGWSDLSEDPNAEQNLAVAAYYFKDSVQIRSAE